jgi:hypothetical protein
MKSLNSIKTLKIEIENFTKEGSVSSNDGEEIKLEE